MFTLALAPRWEIYIRCHALGPWCVILGTRRETVVPPLRPSPIATHLDAFCMLSPLPRMQRRSVLISPLWALVSVIVRECSYWLKFNLCILLFVYSFESLYFLPLLPPQTIWYYQVCLCPYDEHSLWKYSSRLHSLSIPSLWLVVAVDIEGKRPSTCMYQDPRSGYYIAYWSNVTSPSTWQTSVEYFYNLVDG